ncbi:MAG TPA: hypothetical protein DEG17_00785 [Cyanobacteria bacterium UBA11149]|nr:hypothetical protein [Cyanobacteria bacterium UBA11366]HBK63527.1 hypothetical protein [Cyanobacteria bacterium UBA11166]HBR74635.1 hypothetical protein [Cyanobacteria bacterium UBA11159]HBS71311.1 hypothetical protein [Cyanobacteria bacterium UBA11153]HBW87449.1 hypothetical protein [Cyanobacteria bacterium UBA11149]HCA97689.1 hypothetical protein [Cyanobacteria bacterium UBA9226]
MRQNCDRKKVFKISLLAGMVSSWIASPLTSLAQIIPDRTLGRESSLLAPNIPLNDGAINRIDGGAIRGSTLFHSFFQFNVGNSQQVYFANPDSITSIFSRVTGNNPSHIFGTLGVLGNANLYLLNPNGIMFGPGARLDIRGSFVATTSSGVLFNNGYQFNTTNPTAPPLLTINVPLGLDQWLPPRGEITNRGNLSVGQYLSLIGRNLYLEGRLQAGNNLTLQATDTLTIRDSLSNPFIATAGSTLLVQGNHLLDIFALNNPQSGLLAHGDLILRSANPIKIDSHYTTGGNLSVEQLDGAVGNTFSDRDPIVLAAGNVKMGDYTGASLHILAGGSVELGNVRINTPGPNDTTINSNNTNLIPGTSTPYSALSQVTLSDGTTSINIKGDTQATLDIRAGIDWNQAPFTGSPGIATPTDFPGGSVTFAPPTISGSSIQVGKIEIAQSGGLVLLTNQYRPNTTLPAGSINVASIINDKQKIFGFDPFDPNPFFDLGGDIAIDSRGNFSLAVGGKIISAGLVGGDITIKSDTSITFNDASSISDDESNIASVSATQIDGIGGDIRLSSPAIYLTNKNRIDTLYSGNQQSGNIIIEANILNLNQGSRISTGTGGRATGGKITVNADSILLSNQSLISAQTVGPKGGNAGEVEIITNSLVATEGSQISSSTGGVGNAGNVNVTATNSITLSGISEGNPSGIVSIVFPDLPTFIPPFLFPSGSYQGNGNAGVITIETGSILINNGAQVKTSTFGTGNAGIININADTIVLDGAVLAPPSFSQPTIPSGILSEIAPGSQGEGREININTGKLSVTNGAFISASTVSQGDAGNINILASESVSFDGFPGEPFFRSGAYVETKKGATGSGGTLTINTPSLSVTNGATLRALTESSGNAGSIFINGSESIFISGVDTGLFSNTTSDSTGNGGLINLQATTLTLENGAQLNVSTGGRGEAGDIQIDVSKLISLSGENTGIFSSTTPDSTGNGGDIIIDPELVVIKNGAAISVDSQGSGIGGNISIEAEQLRLDNGRISAQTVSTDGGNINLSLSELLLLRRGSQISTTAGTSSAGGNGGNMNIKAGFIVAVDRENSDITANAFLGNGGNIDVITQGLLGIQFRPKLTPLSDITVSSKFGNPGNFNPIILNIDPSSGLLKLPDKLRDPSDEIIVSCAAAEGNSFTITGRGGLPEDPTVTVRGQTLWQDLQDFSAENQAVNTPGSHRQTSLSNLDGQPLDKSSKNGSARENYHLIEATGWEINKDGKVTLVAAQNVDNSQTVNCH